MAHHLFSCWHGDFRLRRKYGEVRRVLLLHSITHMRQRGIPVFVIAAV